VRHRTRRNEEAQQKNRETHQRQLACSAGSSATL